MEDQLEKITEEYHEAIDSLDDDEKQRLNERLDDLNNITDSTIENTIGAVHQNFLQRWKNKLPLINNKNTITMGVITYAGTVKWHTEKINGMFIEKDEEYYIVDLRQLLRHEGKPTLMYYEGNPFPIDFYSRELQPIVSTQALYKAFNAKLTNDLFNTGGISKKAVWTFSVIFGFAIAFVIVWSVISNGTIPFIGG